MTKMAKGYLMVEIWNLQLTESCIQLFHISSGVHITYIVFGFLLIVGEDLLLLVLLLGKVLLYMQLMLYERLWHCTDIESLFKLIYDAAKDINITTKDIDVSYYLIAYSNFFRS